jgi:hypothetical protein
MNPLHHNVYASVRVSFFTLLTPPWAGPIQGMMRDYRRQVLDALQEQV